MVALIKKPGENEVITRQISNLAQYQRKPIQEFLNSLPGQSRVILEIGSDLNCDVLKFLSEETECFSIGVNKSPNFGALSDHPRVHPIRADGESLPIADASIDAVISIATLEHVADVRAFLDEVNRVLRPGGIFYTDFGPIWSCAVGHHVFAQVAGKEARFWKEGRNPIPDYYHLTMSRLELKDFLSEGPCDERLIPPILHWVYDGDGINRLHFEDYIKFFNDSDLEPNYLRGRPRLNQKPTMEQQKLLYRTHGNLDFESAYLEALCTKPGIWSPQKLESIDKFEALAGLLTCPISGERLRYSKSELAYISESGKVKYPLQNGIACLMKSNSRNLN